MLSRRDFLQFAAVTAAATGLNGLTRAVATQSLTQDQLLDFDSKGKLTLLHVTDLHAQLKPLYFRPPSENFGVGAFEGIPPHLVGEEFLSHFNIPKGSALAYAHTMVDYVDMARAYGRLGGLDRTATLVNEIRAGRGDNNVLLLDGGDAWQGSYTSLKTDAQDMVDCMQLLKPDAMVGHWEFTFGEERLLEIVESMGYHVDQKLARVVNGIDVIFTGHTHDAVPSALNIDGTLVMSSGSHGKYLGRVDLDIKDGKVRDYNSTLIPVFSDVITPDADMKSAIDGVRAPYEKELSRVIGKTESLLYRRGNFNGTWDDLICEGILQERDCELAFSPGFRWGTTLLPGQNITIEDLYTQTSMSYPSVYRLEFTGARIKEILEDVCDNLFNKDPFFQQGGDMVRVGGMGYTCEPKAEMGSRISNMTLLKTGEPIDPNRNYVVGGWASVNEGVEGPAIYDLMEKYISAQGSINIKPNDAVRVVGM